MICKVVLLLALVGAVIAEHAFSSQHINKHDGHHELVHHGHGHEHHDYYTHPKYDFEYKVDDPHTHDHKIQHEKRDGDHVENVYSVHKDEDKHGSFHTSVKRYFHHIVPVTHHHHH